MTSPLVLAAQPKAQSVPKVLAKVEPYDVATLEKAVHDFAEEHHIKMGDVVNPLRVATTDPKQFAGLKPEEFEKRMEGLENSARGMA